ncbi:hypothetical protein M0E84_00145 [Corynebacterium sp. CCM 9186]|nr:hypothetical protein [Corynebacterium meridianum]MCK7676460.1 hypothetical protein [Corynebacterium meridianum]
MICPKCSGDNISIELTQVGGRTAKHGTGLGGHINNMARGTMAVCTVGISNLVWKKSEGTEKAKFKSQKVALCQDCGKHWKVR